MPDSASEATPKRRAPRWGLALGLLAIVSAGIFVLAKVVPFEPSAGVAASGTGDAARGATLFATHCAGCHGDKGAGGFGPKLVGVPRQAAAVASVIATGRAAMPAGLVSGTDASDVAAYVASIGGGAAPGANGATTGAPSSGPAGGTATLLGARLQGLALELDEPAPAGWAVWAGGPGGVRRVAALAAGDTTLRLNDAGIGSLAAEGDAVLVGPSADAPALRGDVAGLGELLISSQTAAKGASLLDGASAQIDVLRQHIRFLQRALAERNLANIRFHGEHMVNISRGEPLADVDGNGEASNPGDGVGLVGQPDRDGYLPRIVALAGPDLAGAAQLQAQITAIARDGWRCGQAGSIAAGRPCVQAIAARDPDLARDWHAVRDGVRAKATIQLRRP